MPDTSRKVLIKLVAVGSRPEAVVNILAKIQGLRDTPERLLAQTPCFISGKVPLALAEKAQAFLEKAGAVVTLADEELPAQEEDVTLDMPGEPAPPLSSFDRLQQHLNNIETDADAALDEVLVSEQAEEDVMLFTPDAEATLPPAAPPPAARPPLPEAPPREPAPADEPAPPPVLKPKRIKQKTLRPRLLLPLGILAGIAFLGGLWLLSGTRVSRFTQQYLQTTVGSEGVVAIENPENADLRLYRVSGTQVFEPVALAGTAQNLPRGDYYVEAQKGAQIVRYPVYIQGRGHRVAVDIAFPAQPLPNKLAYIPAGWFRMGNKETAVPQFGFPDEKPDIDVYVSALLMSKYEVTNREYAQFVAAGGYKNQAYWDALLGDWDSLATQFPEYKAAYGNDGWNSVNAYLAARFVNTDGKPGPRLWEEDTPPYEDGADDYPVLGLTFYEAAAYCAWFSQQSGKVYRLPTEAEWEKAARGYEGYFFAYGNEYNAARANTETGNPRKVGVYPPNGYGVYDLTGNAWEWVSDQYRADAYQYLREQGNGDIRNPKVFNAAKPYDRRIVRGGSFRSVNRVNAKSTVRYPMFPNYWHTNIGFRYVTLP